MIWATFNKDLKTGIVFIIFHLLQPFYKSETIIAWFEEHGINFLDWPNKYQGKSIGDFGRTVFHKEYAEIENVNELKERILEAGENIPETPLNNLILNLPLRLLQIIRNNGKGLSY